MKNKITLSLITVAILGLNGCGGDNSSAGTPQAGTTGHVGDGYIQGAYVCHDSNNDMDCLDETYATTNSNGGFSLSNYDASKDLLVQIPIGAVDNGPFVNGSTTPRTFTQQTWYFYPAQAAPNNGPIFIGPLSTLVYAQINSQPGISVSDATSAVGSVLGINSSSLLDNYLENNSQEGTNTNFVAELVGSSLANYASSTTASNYDVYIENVLTNANGIESTATSNNPLTYDTASYNAIPNGTVQTQPIVALTYLPVSDVCSDLENGNYFSFEGWNSLNNGVSDKRHKTLYIKTNASTGEKTLEINVQKENNNAWSIDAYHTSTENLYLQKEESIIIDMSQVNSSNNYTTVTHDIPFPSKNIACNGSSATFKIGAFIYKLHVSEADISGLNGAVLPQGSSVNSILSPVTFATGDKIYKASISSQNGGYSISKGQSIDPSDNTVYVDSPNDYLVYDNTFSSISNTNNINTMVQSLNSEFIIEHRDSSNYEKFKLTSTAASNNTGTVDFIRVNAGVTEPTVSMSYEVETHNGTAFFVVKNYNGIGRDLFIGKIIDIDANNFVFGHVGRGGPIHYITQGGFQDGDIMDDIMLNNSARDRVLTQLNTQNNINIPTPSLP